MKHLSTIPFAVTERVPGRVLLISLSINCLFLLLHLWGACPSVQNYFGYPLDSINLNKEANLPTNWAIIQLYFAAVVCTLMIFWYPAGRCPAFWKIGVVVLFVFGFDESAQLHELWSAGVFPLIFGAKGFMSGNRPTLLIYGLLLGVFYLSAALLFFRTSRRALVLLVLSGISLVLSQATEISLPGALQLHAAGMTLGKKCFPEISGLNLNYAWEEGLEMVCYSLIVTGVLRGARDTQHAAETNHIFTNTDACLADTDNA